MSAMVQGLRMDVEMLVPTLAGALGVLVTMSCMRLPCGEDSLVSIVFKLIQQALLMIEIEEWARQFILRNREHRV